MTGTSSASSVRRLILASFALPFLTAVCICLGVSESAHADPIQLEVHHEEVLPPLPPQFQAGAEVDESPPAQPHLQWFPIPPWMAGTWTKQGDVEDSAVNLQTGQQLGAPVFVRNVVTLSFGDQEDNRGGVWHAQVLPFRTDGFNGNMEDRRFVTQMDCVKNTAQQVILSVRSFVTTIDTKKNKVKTSKQQEEIITFQPLNAEQIETLSSTRTYSSTGEPITQARSHTTRSRAANFAPVPAINGIDLKRSLAEYLVAHNWAYLVPQ